ncbi:MAG: DUF4340 domain-containing protein [Clostridiales bacterium]|nr:DUF4340 domain-containing protein [Clostridiales bacterium]
MSKKKQKQLTIMVVIVAAMAAILVVAIQLNNWNTARQEAAEDAAIPRVLTLDDVTGVTFVNGDSSLEFLLNDDDEWYWADDEDFLLDDTAVATVAGLAEDFQANASFEIADDLSAYGLEDPDLAVIYTTEDGDTYTLLVGGTTGDYYYAMLEDGDTIYTIADTLATNLGYDLYYMADLADYPSLSSDIIQDVTLTSGDSEITFTIGEVEVEISDDEDEDADSSAEGDASSSSSEPETEIEYHWFLDGEDVTDQSQITSLNTEVDSISMYSLAAFKPTDEALEVYGLTEPTMTLTVRYTDEDDDGDEITVTSVLTVGGYNEDEDAYYCTLDTNPNEVYLISASSIETSLELAANGLTYDSEDAEDTDADTSTDSE